MNVVKNLCDIINKSHIFHQEDQVDMTSGPIAMQLVCFMVPILASQLLQQFYNITDTMFVGRYIGAAALAAVGTTGLLLSVIVNFIIGLSAGVSVIVSQLYGSKAFKELNNCVQTILVACGVIGLMTTIVALVFLPNILELLETPLEIVPMAACYLQICLWGIIPQLIYNSSTAIMRSLGNTCCALYYLIVSIFVNLVLDYILLVQFNLGIQGAAWATLAAQIISAMLITYKLFTTEGEWHFTPAKKLVDLLYLKELMTKGIPAGMQAVFMSISSLVIQTYINSFGYAAMAGMTIYARVEGFLYYPLFSFGIALTSFVGQNIGARKFARVSEGIHISLKLTVIGSIITSALAVFFAGNIMSLFTDDAAVLANGMEAVLYNLPFYWLYAINQIYIGGIRGMGHTFYPMITSLCSYCIFRVAWCQGWDLWFHDMRIVYTSYDTSWILMLGLLYFGYKYYFQQTVNSSYKLVNA